MPTRKIPPPFVVFRCFVAQWNEGGVKGAVTEAAGGAYYNTTAAALALFDEAAQQQVATVHRALGKLN